MAMCIILCQWTSGVYLSHEDVFLENDSRFFINEIGSNTASPQSAVVCTSDRMPCCKQQPQYGEWKFPGGGLVQSRSQQPSTYVRTRDDIGNVNLFRVTNAVISPTGRFCCEVENATGNNQTLCINIVCKFSVNMHINSG